MSIYLYFDLSGYMNVLNHMFVYKGARLVTLHDVHHSEVFVTRVDRWSRTKDL